ncbi:sulfatase-like hydrolase/transferase [Haloferula sp.]|uniref:sulfatase-like hydrolase/transferase n=1 Tax=Haloferula sp. TaxID=2497595 RepID=UPI00329AC24E
MKRILLLTVCLIGSEAVAENEKANHAKASSGKPNILFIFADDMSFETIGAHGLLDIDTPNLDTLVERGASFTHAYNMGAWGGAVCVASRAMLNTGKFVWDAQSIKGSTLREKKHTWSQRMHEAGYQTYMSGKWHVTKFKVSDVFDVSKNVRPGGMPKDFRSKGSSDGSKPKGYGYKRPIDEEDYKTGWKPWDKTNGGFWEGGTHWSEVLADDGVEFLQQAASDDKPFFMYLAFNAPHDPRQAPKEFIDRYPLSRIKLPENFLPEYPYAKEICGKFLRDERLMPYPRTEYSVKVNRQEYFALITHMDEQIGKILQALKKSGKADNTYIVFTADHGLAVGHHGLCGKQNMYDHSVRPPFLVVGPQVKAGSKIDVPIYLQDVMATALDWAGADAEGVDFKSVVPLLKGKTEKQYDVIYGAYTGTQRMITVDGWKLIAYPTVGKMRLFNLSKDPQEMNDLSENPEYAGQLERLSAELENLMDDMKDPMASIDSGGSTKSKEKDSN